MTVSTPGTILIVDDDEDAALLLRDALRRRGFTADAIDSGRAALERLATIPVDAVVTDVQMPGMTGIELCLELHRRHANQLAIVITGRDGAEIRRSAREAGAYAFMIKPVDVGALAATLAEAMADLARRLELPAASQPLPIRGIDA